MWGWAWEGIKRGILLEDGGRGAWEGIKRGILLEDGGRGAVREGGCSLDFEQG